MRALYIRERALASMREGRACVAELAWSVRLRRRAGVLVCVSPLSGTEAISRTHERKAQRHFMLRSLLTLCELMSCVLRASLLHNARARCSFLGRCGRHEARSGS